MPSNTIESGGVIVASNGTVSWYADAARKVVMVFAEPVPDLADMAESVIALLRTCDQIVGAYTTDESVDIYEYRMTQEGLAAFAAEGDAVLVS